MKLKKLPLISASVKVPSESPAEFEALVASGGFDVKPCGEPWSTKKIVWQDFVYHQNGGIAAVSIASWLDHSDASIVTVSSVRRFLGIWLRRRDIRVMKGLMSHLLANGGYQQSAFD